MAISSLTKLIGTVDVCRTFSISRRTLDNWIAHNTIPVGFLVGGKRYWREEDINAFIEKSAHANRR